MKKFVNFIKSILHRNKKKTKYNPINLYSPTKNGMIKSEEVLIQFEDGDAIRYYTYSVFPENSIDNQPLLNIYGQKIYNDVVEEGK